MDLIGATTKIEILIHKHRKMKLTILFILISKKRNVWEKIVFVTQLKLKSVLRVCLKQIYMKKKFHIFEFELSLEYYT